MALIAWTPAVRSAVEQVAVQVGPLPVIVGAASQAIASEPSLKLTVPSRSPVVAEIVAVKVTVSRYVELVGPVSSRVVGACATAISPVLAEPV